MLLFESFKNIEDICEIYNIKNYTINPDESVDVDDYVDNIKIFATQEHKESNSRHYHWRLLRRCCMRYC